MTHNLWPPAFRAAVRTLLLIQLRKPDGEPRHPRSKFTMLPPEMVMNVIQMLARVWPVTPPASGAAVAAAAAAPAGKRYS